jgi:hypothetical protein
MELDMDILDRQHPILTRGMEKGKQRKKEEEEREWGG